MARQAFVVLAVVVAFGVLVPWYKGLGFLDPRVMAAYACLALLFVAPASAELSTLHAQKAPPALVLTRVGAIVAYGWGVTVLILATGLVTVNLANWRGAFAAPPFRFVAALLTFSLFASAAVAALAGALARRYSASGVKSILRTVFLLVLLLLVFGSRFLPDQWQFEILDHLGNRRALTRLALEGAGVSAVLAALLLLPLLNKPGDGHN